MAREWEVIETKEFDENDFWYKRYNIMQQERQVRKFKPEEYQEFDLRSSDARRYKYTERKYLREDFRRKNSYKGMFD